MSESGEPDSGNSMKKRFELIFVLFFFPALFAAAGNALAIYPLVTDDTGTQGDGKVQLQLSGEYDSSRDVSVADGAGNPRVSGLRTSFMDANIAVGIGGFIDLTVNVPYGWNMRKTGGEKINTNGFQDITALLKWRFSEKKPVSFALEPFVTFPSGNIDKGLGNGRAGGGAIFITTAEFEKFVLHANANYYRNENKAGSRTDLWHFSAAGIWKLSERFSPAADLGIDRNPDPYSGIDPAYILGGFIYSLRKDLEFGFGMKFGLNSTAPGYSVLAGLTFHF